MVQYEGTMIESKLSVKYLGVTLDQSVSAEEMAIETCYFIRSFRAQLNDLPTSQSSHSPNSEGREVCMLPGRQNPGQKKSVNH